MAGSFDFDPYALPLSGAATPVGVFRYDSAQGYVLLPNVRCERIEYREGPQPPAAHFSYMLDDADAAIDYPSQFELLWPLAASGPYVVRNDDRLVVLATAPSGGNRVLFDGFAQVPQVELSASSQRVSFLAVGVSIRCWDSPIGGRYERHADDPKNGKTVSIDRPTRFNPDGQPNCTPDGYDVNESTPAVSYPVFLDPKIDRQPDPRTYWTLGKFVRYILSVQNDGSYVQNPDFTQLDALLQARAPLPGSGFVDPDQSGDYTSADVVIRDFDATNLAWPEALELQLGYAGFGMRFVTGEDGGGNPWQTIELYRKDAAGQGSPLDLRLPPRGSTLDPGQCNVAALNLVRDARAIVNAITVETQQRRVEVSLVLAPGFSPQTGDETAASRVLFLRANLATASGDVRRKYRYYVADEAGDGHYDLGSTSWLTTALDLSPIFPNDQKGNLTYVKRLRPGASTLVSRDSLGHPLKAQLALSRDYKGKAPAVWDGSGTWQPITGDLPQEGNIHVIRESSKNVKLLFVGTEFGVFGTLDGGNHWHRMKNGIPPTILTHDLVIHPRDRDLVVGTHGRSIYVMDISPLEEMNSNVLASDIHLFDVRPATAFKFKKVDAPPEGPGYVCPNPPYGASINYYLADDAAQPVTIAILDKDGKTLVELTGEQKAGLRQVVWNLRAAQGSDELVPPGDYTARLQVGPRTLTKTIKVEAEQ